MPTFVALSLGGVVLAVLFVAVYRLVHAALSHHAVAPRALPSGHARERATALARESEEYRHTLARRYGPLTILLNELEHRGENHGAK